jgi:hypothetical protein
MMMIREARAREKEAPESAVKATATIHSKRLSVGHRHIRTQWHVHSVRLNGENKDAHTHILFSLCGVCNESVSKKKISAAKKEQFCLRQSIWLCLRFEPWISSIRFHILLNLFLSEL